MANADYNYSIQKHVGKPLLLIEDKNLGNMSVTNDIENVVSEICNERKLNCNECLILFKDSENIWDEWDCKSKNFIHLGGLTWKEALERR